MQMITENAVEQMEEERKLRMLKLNWQMWRHKFGLKKRAEWLRVIKEGRLLVKYLDGWRQASYQVYQQKKQANIELRALQQAYAYHLMQRTRVCFTGLLAHMIRHRKVRQAQ
jgi:hypothetical protein